MYDDDDPSLIVRTQISGSDLSGETSDCLWYALDRADWLAGTARA
jgi:hypothetical protein